MISDSDATNISISSSENCFCRRFEKWRQRMANDDFLMPNFCLNFILNFIKELIDQSFT
jgi:hypothetical protein